MSEHFVSGVSAKIAHCVGITNMSTHDNLSPAIKIYRRRRSMRSSSASRKDYRLVINYSPCDRPGPNLLFLPMMPKIF